MNKAWITGLTIAGVAASAGAAYAGISSDNQATSSVEAQGLPAVTSTTAASRTATYQVGAAGTVTITAANGVLTVDSAMPGEYFTVLGYSSPAAHVEAQFADAAQQITFIADLVDGDIVVSVTNVPAPGATTTSIEVTEITNGSGTVAAPQPAVPAAAKPIVVAVPSPSHTSGTSHAGAGTSHEDDDDHSESHEVEHEDGGDDD